MAAARFFNLKKILLILIIAVVIFTTKFLDKFTENIDKKWGLEPTMKNSTNLKDFSKIFHLDLKGGPPKLSYLISVLPLIKKSGANGILIEYEDMFPFSGALRNISAKNAYSLHEVRTLVSFAESLGFDVIPLVQTFGHLEYVLKLEEFQHLRELESFPQEICPSKKEAVDLVKEMIRQIMAVHGNSRFLHIGCDEVRHVGACSRCSTDNPKKIFSKHVKRIANFVGLKYPKVTPLIWDDMLRRWTFDDMLKSGLGEVVQPVVWVYGNNILVLVPEFVWHIYQRVFSTVWVSSAFKGAFGETEIIPDLGRHLENHLSWMNFLSNMGIKPATLGGIIVTGWSRYDHFAVLCELLPTGLPSLVLGMVFLQPRFQENHRGGLEEWAKLLGCPKGFMDGEDEFFMQDLSQCTFSGKDLYVGVAEFQKLKARVKEIQSKIESSGWLTTYNIKKNFTSPWRVIEMFPEEGFAGEVLRKEIHVWKSSFLPIMKQYFDEYIVSEWTEQNIWPVEVKMKEIRELFQNLIVRKTWPRRPLG